MLQRRGVMGERRVGQSRPKLHRLPARILRSPFHTTRRTMGKSKTKSAAAAMSAASSEAAPAPASGLSSFLLGQAPARDDALDDIFAHSVRLGWTIEYTRNLLTRLDCPQKGPSLAYQPKEKEPAAEAPSAPATTAGDADASSDEDEAEQVDDDDDEVLSELDSDAELSDENEADLEEAYAARIAAAKAKAHQASLSKKRKAEPEASEESDSDDDDDDDEAGQLMAVEDDGVVDINDIISGALAEDNAAPKSGPKAAMKQDDKGKKSAKLLKREQESPEARDARTVFLGNIPADCSTSRVCGFFPRAPSHRTDELHPPQPLKKALVRHVLENPALAANLPEGCPPLKLDSIRFRSIAFASKVFGRKATTGAGADGAGEDAGGRARKRAKEWREAEGSDVRGVRGGFHAKDDGEAGRSAVRGNGRTQPLTDAQKRKVALIRGELNEGKKACNAYLVLAALPESVDVSAVMRAVVQAANNSVFEGFTIHADHVRPRSAAALLAAAQMAAKPNENLTDVPRNSDAYQVAPADARRTIFIGGLDFAESEENVRAAVEACLVRERGELPAGERYVQNVRVVRDPSSGLGKGFCYVLLLVRLSRLFCPANRVLLSLSMLGN